MPGWILDIIIGIALKFGLPYVITVINKYAPWLLKFLPANFIEIITQYLENLKGAKKIASTRIKDECLGIGCPTDLK